MCKIETLASPAQGNSRFLSLLRITADAPGEVTLSTGGEEHVIDILAGLCSVDVDSRGGAQHFEGVGGRADIFGGRPEFVFVPLDSTYAVKCMRGPFEAIIYTAPTEDTSTPVHVSADQVKAVVSGTSDWQRDVYIGLGDDGPSTRILVGETESPPGNWSGFPPHRHTQDQPPTELSLEELYYLKFEPQTGFAIGGIYQDVADRAGTAEMFFVQDSRFFDVPTGYHFIAPCPGYRLRYTWALGGKRTQFGAWVADPDYAWLAN
jgi:5-deoxy-glucuronate isomerase